MELKISGNRQIVDGELAEDQPDVRVSEGNPQSDLHDKRDRIAELLFAKDHENQSRLPNGRSGDEIDLAGIAKYREKVDNADSEPESGDESICDHF